MPDVAYSPEELERKRRLMPWSQRWATEGSEFVYGDPNPPPLPPPPGHRGTQVGPFGERVVCMTCGAICLPDHDLGIWLDTDTFLQDGDDDGDVPNSLPHAYPFGNASVEGVKFWTAIMESDDDDAPLPVAPGSLVDEVTLAMERHAADQARRRDLGVAGYQRNRPDRPSKTPEGRQEEYAKARETRRARQGDGRAPTRS